ncbi:MAG: exo-alpha-sialidase [Anaerolineae bacterium]|nr:exo-alpha-sialidase [Anaerolineae bacterium]
MLQSGPVFSGSSDFPSCHAATVVEAAPGVLLAAWFAGTYEGHPDVAIWLSRYAGGDRWSAPVKIVAAPGVPLWNPVLFRDTAGVVWLFYKAGPTVSAWSGLYLQSTDAGRSWSAPVMLPAGLTGPAKNKPITLSNGDILCGVSAETWRNWTAWAEISADGGRSWTRHGPITAPLVARSETGHSAATWTRHGPITAPLVARSETGHSAATRSEAGQSVANEPVSATWDTTTGQLRLPQEHLGVIQPTVWEYAPGQVKMLLRATQAVGAVCITESSDYGRTWAPARPTPIPHSNTGLDAVRLTDGRIVLACNPTHEGRSPLTLLISTDNGETWPRRLDLETAAGEFSYPSIIQAADGRLHLVYTYRRAHIQHVIIDLDVLT